ncbi:MAG: L,D-transpeptidase family protein [Methyloceanibacter sp.]|uniref:L,D-transpeptidase family protein n=1 Tax=Methyloceanibacter sp. TaxID=1965321 RepID=UPI003D6C9A64
MPKFTCRLSGGAILAAIGLAVALLVVSVEPSSAGPFNWFKGKNQGQGQNQPPDQYNQYQAPQAQPGPPQGGGGLFGGLFGGGKGASRTAPSHESHASELPEGDPEVAMIVNPALGLPTLSTNNIAATKAAIEKYKAIVAQGGWPAVPAVAMKPGARGQEIVILHKRLEVSGDLVGMSIPDEYDAAVVAAMKKFQVRHGLPPTGVVDSKATVEALNVPASVRLAQLEANLRRLQSLAPSAAGRHVLVNVPAAQVEAVEGRQVVQRHAAVVGKIERPTPELSSKISEINFNPYWHVPRSIVHKDLVPKGRQFAQRGQDMLAAYHMEAFDQQGNPLDPRQIDWFGEAVYSYNFRQRPWEENSLGFVKINFANKDAVYLHDTPLKSLFGKAIRFESSGCVRVHNVSSLVAWIMRDNPGWSLNRIEQMKHTGEQIDVKVANPIPIYLAYVSAWATPDGQVHFRPDIYNHDAGAFTASAY